MVFEKLTVLVFLLSLARCLGQDDTCMQNNCVNCASAKIFGIHCRWCPVDNLCHAPGAVLTNNCTSNQNIVDPLKCPSPQPPQTSYSPSLSYTLLLYSYAAYLGNPSESFLPATTVVKFKYSHPMIDGTSVFVFGAVDPVAKGIYVVFQGTNSTIQLIDELLNKGAIQYPGVTNGALVDEYFLASTGLLYNETESFVSGAVAQNPGYTVYCTGHSLGGAMAAITAFELTRLKIVSSPVVYTFGQPRTGNAIWAHLFNTAVPNAFRVVNARDPVPQLPHCNQTHFGSVCIPDPPLSGWAPFHHSTEIWYTAGSWVGDVLCGYKECVRMPIGEDLSCQDSLQTFDILLFGQHSMYWNVILKGWCNGRLEIN